MVLSSHLATPSPLGKNCLIAVSSPRKNNGNKLLLRLNMWSYRHPCLKTKPWSCNFCIHLSLAILNVFICLTKRLWLICNTSSILESHVYQPSKVDFLNIIRSLFNEWRHFFFQLRMCNTVDSALCNKMISVASEKPNNDPIQHRVFAIASLQQRYRTIAVSLSYHSVIVIASSYHRHRNAPSHHRHPAIAPPPHRYNCIIAASQYRHKRRWRVATIVNFMVLSGFHKINHKIKACFVNSGRKFTS